MPAVEFRNVDIVFGDLAMGFEAGTAILPDRVCKAPRRVARRA